MLSCIYWTRRKRNSKLAKFNQTRRGKTRVELVGEDRLQLGD
jgi:hypothetical protein